MGYEYHVFLSYRRHGEWPQWVQEKFLPLFTHWLGEELGDEELKVFFDLDMETGAWWPSRLNYALARSCVLVPLLSRQYFHSEWCKTELSHMLAREEACGFGTRNNPCRLIIPAIIHDGQDLPECVRGISSAQLESCSNVRIARDSLTEEILSERIRRWVPDIVRIIEKVPDCDSGWSNLTADKFIGLFERTQSRQGRLPRIG